MPDVTSFNYRLEYSKLGNMKFIGHIDLMKLFHKLFRMSGLPIAFSQGFNPHQIFTIAHPLSLGMEGLAEPADFRLHASADAGEIAVLLNANAPTGLLVTNVRQLAPGEKNCAGLVAAADYTANAHGIPGLTQAAAGIMAAAEVIAAKRTKSGTTRDDIRKDIHSLAADDSGTVQMRLSAGSSANLKPQLVLSRLIADTGADYDEYAHSFTRTRLLCRGDGGFEAIRVGS